MVLLKNESVTAQMPIFLTAYDPSDLPGGSLDPLGFERGYLFLADKMLPGLTNVANRPRYFSVLCAGASLADVDRNSAPRQQYKRRLDCIERIERFWALGNVLASKDASDENLAVSGIRGVTYATDRADAVLRSGARRVGSDFKMLSRQVPYGVVGIYGAVAEGMRLIDRSTFTLTPDLGERLAEGFLAETEAPSSLIKAIREDGEIPLQTLAEWGRRAHIAGEMFPTERLCLKEALNCNPVRSRMAEVLSELPFAGARDTEILRLNRLLPALARNTANADLHESVLTILAYEACYQLVMLGFERLLWLCRADTAGAIRPTDTNADSVLRLVCDRLPAASSVFGQTLDRTQTEQFRLDLQRLEDVRRFLENASASCSSPESLIQEIMARHCDIQRGKLDRGRRKMPWLESISGRISLTMTRVGGRDGEATKPSDIAPHPYRLSSADALIAVAEEQ